MHELRIRNGAVYLDEKKMNGVYSYKLKNSATDGKMAELTLKITVILGEIEIEPKK